MMSRFFLLALVSCILLVGISARCPRQQGPASLPDLPYDAGALEPCFDTETMQLHHNVLHKHYVDTINDALKDEKELSNEKLDRIVTWVGTRKMPKDLHRVVRRYGGGAWNHEFFWKVMTPKDQAKDPNEVLADELKRKIKDKFGSIDEMKLQFTDMALQDVFGSGWVWLCSKNRHGDLMLTWTQNQDNPMMYAISEHHDKPCLPILGLDMWEHDFLFKYKADKRSFVNCFWNIVNWEQVNKNYKDAMKFFESEMNTQSVGPEY